MHYFRILTLLSIMVALSAFQPGIYCSDAQQTPPADYSKEYRDLLIALGDPSFSALSSYGGVFRDLPAVKAFSKHGPAALPFLMDRLEKAKKGEGLSRIELAAIMEIICRITKRGYSRPDDLQTWWNTGGKDTPQQFATLHAEWQKAVKELTDADKPLLLKTSDTVLDSDTLQVVTTEKETDLGKIYRQIRELGIEILPLLLDAAQKGDYTLLPLFADLSDNHSEDYWGPERRTKNLANWWEKNKDAYIIPFPETSGSAPPAEGGTTPPASNAPAPPSDSGSP